MIWLLFTTALGHAACPEAVPAGVLFGMIAEAESQFSAGNAESFKEASRSARAVLPCLSEPVTPVLAAAWHRLDALEAMVTLEITDRPVVVSAFRAMLAADPGYALPTSLNAEGSVLPSWLREAAQAGQGLSAPFTAPERTILLFDGKTSAERPLDRPVIVQLQWQDDRRIHHTAALHPGDPLPDYSALGVLPPVEEEPLPPERRRLSRPLTMALTGGAFALSATSGAFLGLGYANRAAWLDRDTPYEERPALIARSHTLSIAGVSAAVGALGLGGVALSLGQL